MANWVDSFSKIGEVVVGLGSAIATGYSNVVIGQATAGYFDSMTNMNLASIDNAISSVNEQKKAKELAKQITSINGKMKNGLTLTEEEYMFMVNNGYMMSDYKLNNDGTATRINSNEISNEISNDLKFAGLSTKGYITLGVTVLLGVWLIKKIF